MEERIDPDPFTVIVGCAAIVGAACSVIQVAQNQRKKRPEYLPESSTGLELFTKAVTDSIRDIERLVKFLSATDVCGEDTLSLPFRYGSGPLFLENEPFRRFGSLSTNVLHNLEYVHSTALMMARHEPHNIDRIGIPAIEALGDFRATINDFYRGDYTNGAVLEQCLHTLRILERILVKLEN